MHLVSKLTQFLFPSGVIAKHLKFIRPEGTFRTLAPFIALLGLLGTLTGCSIPAVPFSLFSSDSPLVRSLPEESKTIDAAGHPARSGHNSPVIGLFLLPGSPSEQLISVDSSGTVLLWNLSRASAVELMKTEIKPEFVAVLPERGLLAVSRLGAVYVYNVRTGEQLWSLKRLKARVTALSFQSDGKALLIGGADGRVYRWKYIQEVDAGTVDEREKSLERYVAHSSVISAVIAHPYGRAFFSGDWKGGMYAFLPFDSDGFRAEYEENFFGGRFFSKESTFARGDRLADAGIAVMTMSKDGQRFVIGTQDGWIEVWRVKGFKRLVRFEAHRGLVYSVAVNDDASNIVSVGRDGRMKWFQVEPDPKFGLDPDASEYKRTQLADYTLPQARLVELRDDRHVISCDEDGTIVEITLSRTAPKKEDELIPKLEIGPIGDPDY